VRWMCIRETEEEEEDVCGDALGEQVSKWYEVYGLIEVV